MGEEHNVVFGQGPKVNKAKSTPTSPSICLMRHIEEEVSVLLALLTLGPCPKITLCSSPIAPLWPLGKLGNSGPFPLLLQWHLVCSLVEGQLGIW